MTCFGENGISIARPVDDVAVPVQQQTTATNFEPTKNQSSGTVNSIGISMADITVNKINTIPTLHAIDMTQPTPAYNITDQSFDGSGDMALLKDFQELRLEESKSTTYQMHSHLAQESREGWSGEESHCETKSHQSSRSNRDDDIARNLLLFTGDEDGDTPLHISVMQEEEKQSIQIINTAPDFPYLDVQNNLLQTPLHLAALTNSPTTLRRLICAGAEIISQDRDGNTPLHIACHRGHLEIVKQLMKPVTYQETLENKYPIPYVAIPQNMNVKNYDGLSCLHHAVLRQDLDIARLLLEAGADPNFGDSKSGRTVLHLAAEQGSLDMVRLLLNYRTTEIDVRNYAGHTPALLAYSRGHLAVTELLIRYGAFYGLLHGGDMDASASSDDSDMDV